MINLHKIGIKIALGTANLPSYSVSSSKLSRIYMNLLLHDGINNKSIIKLQPFVLRVVKASKKNTVFNLYKEDV